MIYTTYNVFWIAVQVFYILLSHTTTLIGSKNDFFYTALQKEKQIKSLSNIKFYHRVNLKY